jgi:2-octaprenyl-6-methoxyphenol hydroxylase
MCMIKNFDSVIGGGGSIGLVCALVLAHQGLSVLVLDKSLGIVKTNHAFDGRNIALNSASVRLFEKLGIWEALKHKAQPINDIIVSDGTLLYGASESFLHFDANHINQESFGYFALNPDIHHALIERAKSETRITLQYDTQITDIEYTENSVTITDNHNNIFDTKLLIGADGKQSFIRSHANIDTHGHDYRQTAIVLAVSHEKPHQGIAQEFFLPSGPFAILPLMGNQSSLVWVEKHHIAQAFLNAPDNVFQYELERRFGNYLGDLKIISQKFSYPLVSQIAKSITAHRTILIGDAAHSIHPISGQGFNLGVRDIAYLADIIQYHHYAGLDIGSDLLLHEYTQKRQQDIELFGNLTTALNWLFSNDNCILQHSRRFGLGLVNKIPKLKNFFGTAASNGSIGTLPSLLQHE